MFRIILMCLLTCCSSFMPLKQSSSNICEDHTQVVETKTRENYVYLNSGYYQYGTSDLFSYDFLKGLIDYYVNDLGVTQASYNNNETLNNYVIRTSGVYKVFYYDVGNKAYQQMFSVSNIVLTKGVPNPQETYPYLYYNFQFGNASPYNYVVTISWYAQRTDNNHVTIWGVDLGVSGALDLIHSSSYWYSNFMLDEKVTDYDSFIANIFTTIRSEPQQIAYNQGYSDGYNAGYGSGETTGYQNGYNAGETAGYQNGFQQGVDDTIASGTEAMTIFSGIMDVAFIPVNVFFLMFDYDVFGINIAGLVSALLTIAVVLIIFRFIAGRKV